MNTKMKIVWIAVVVLALSVLAVAGTAYAKSKKPVLVVICPVESTIIDYKLKPGYVELIAYEKCMIMKGSRASKEANGKLPSDPPEQKKTPFVPVNPTTYPKVTQVVPATQVIPVVPPGWNKSPEWCALHPNHWKCVPPYLPPGQNP